MNELILLPQCVRITARMVMRGAVSAQPLFPAFQVLISSFADFPHEHARSRAFRWGEDGIAGVSDTHGFQNIAFAFWNGEE